MILAVKRSCLVKCLVSMLGRLGVGSQMATPYSDSDNKNLARLNDEMIKTMIIRFQLKSNSIKITFLIIFKLKWSDF